MTVLVNYTHFHENGWNLVKITILAPRGPQKAPNMTRILYVFVHGARKVLKSHKNHQFGENDVIVVKYHHFH